MTATERELTQRIADLEGALRAIGRVLDDTAPPRRRLDRIHGIVSMYATPVPAKGEQP